MSDSPSLTGLNPEQKEAVLHGKGPLLVLAGAGACTTPGTTHPFAPGGRAPGGPPAPPPPALAFIGTFHAWSLRLLRRYAAAAQVPPRFAIADAADQLALVKEAMAELQISDQVLPPGAVRARISSAKNALVTAKKFEETQTD